MTGSMHAYILMEVELPFAAHFQHNAVHIE